MATHLEDRKPLRWIVVEKTVAELTTEVSSGDGRLESSALVLTMQPLYAEDLNWEVVVDPHDFYVEVLEIFPGGQASTGETITAKVRVARAKEHASYVLIARPSRADVKLIGSAKATVRGGGIVTFRFTSLTAGRGGIQVSVEKATEGAP
jgi:hypothetical protein